MRTIGSVTLGVNEGPEVWLTLVVAPIVVGILLWSGSEGVRWLIARRVGRRDRRLRIVGALYQAESIVFRAVRDRDFERSWIAESTEPLRSLRERYDDLAVETFRLFNRGEEEVAYWVAVEFHAGFSDPLYSLGERKIPHAADADGRPLLFLDARGEKPPFGWQPPRGEQLLAWAAGGKGPRYADIFTSGDHSRHHIVKPNTDVNVDMLRPPIWMLGRGQQNRPRSRWAKIWHRKFKEPSPSTRDELEACGVCAPHAAARPAT